MALPDRPGRSRPPNLLGAFAALLVAALVAAFAVPERALAHAALATSEPADGGMVPAAPAAVRLTFSEPVSPLVLRLIGPDGAAAELSGARLEGDALVVPLPPGGGEGTYVLSYRVVSADGHPVGGALVFAVGDAPPAAVSAGGGDPLRTAAVWASRAAVLGGILFGAGGALFLAFAGTPPTVRARRPVAAALAVTALAAPVTVAVQGLDALDLSFAALAGGPPWRAALGSPWTVTVGGILVAAALATASLAAGGLVMRRLLALVGLAVLAFAASLSGHVVTAPPEAISHRFVSLHVGAAAVWVGALAPLAVVVAAGGQAATAALRSFARVAPYAVAVLVLSGLTLAALQMRTPAALWTTDYGRVLLAKLALVAVLLALAAVNRWRLATTTLAGDDAARRRLVKVVAVETALALAIVGVLALWRFTPPPRTLAAAASAPAEVHIHTERAMATLSMTPGRAGQVSVGIALQTGDFGRLAAKEVEVAFANPEAGIEPIRRDAAPAGGDWRIDGLALPVAGTWTVRVDVLVSDFETLRLEGAVTLAP